MSSRLQPRSARTLRTTGGYRRNVVLAATVISLGLCVAEKSAPAGDLHVDREAGADTNDGRSAPVRTIARAIRLAGPGDTIHLAPGTWRESAVFIDRHGEPGRPITLDGHGAVLDGSEPVTATEWEEVEPGLFRRKSLYPKTDEAIVARWYLVWDGEMRRMGRSPKGIPADPLKPAADLLPGEWTYARDEDAFYLRLPEGQSLAEAKIRYPKRSSAVIFASSGSNITVRNLTATHVYNDGFNIHGAQRNLRFENIAAIECGDDGFSAHEDAVCHIDGFTSIGNATGLCDTGTSRTHYRNVLIRDCVGFDLYFIGREHSLENARIESRAAKAFWLDGNHLEEDDSCRLHMKNVLLARVGDTPQEIRINRRGVLRATNCSFEGINVMLTPGGAVDFRSCLFRNAGHQPEALLYPDTSWRGENNRYDFRSLRAGQRSFTRETFPEFREYTGSEPGSRWEAVDTAPDGIGADETNLPASSEP